MTAERITRQNVEERVANVNRRMESRGSIVRYAVEGRNNSIGLDRYHVTGPSATFGHPVSQVTFGSKREIADFLHAMMVALDDSSYTE